MTESAQESKATTSCPPFLLAIQAALLSGSLHPSLEGAAQHAGCDVSWASVQGALGQKPPFPNEKDLMLLCFQMNQAPVGPSNTRRWIATPLVMLTQTAPWKRKATSTPCPKLKVTRMSSAQRCVCLVALSAFTNREVPNRLSALGQLVSYASQMITKVSPLFLGIPPSVRFIQERPENCQQKV